jgi:hypothetical protein
LVEDAVVQQVSVVEDLEDYVEDAVAQLAADLTAADVELLSEEAQESELEEELAQYMAQELLTVQESAMLHQDVAVYAADYH